MNAELAKQRHAVGRKKPQLSQQQANVVPRSTQHRVQRITKCALERIATEPAVGLHVPDRRFDRNRPVSTVLPRACRSGSECLGLNQ